MFAFRKLIVVGNGFDLAHGLNTRYSDFRIFLENYDSLSENFKNKLTKYLFLEGDWSNIESSLSQLNFEELCDDNSDLNVLDYADDNFKCSSYHDYPDAIKDGTSFIDKLPYYLKLWIKNIQCADIERKFSFIDNNSLYLSFNYSDTLERVYGINKNNILHIHGYSQTDDDLICGHCDSNIIQDSSGFETEDWEYMDFQIDSVKHDYYNKSFKNERAIINKNKAFFENVNKNNINEIIIIGHSFEYDIDLKYFVHLTTIVSPVCKWTFTYYSESDKQNNERMIHTLNLYNYVNIHINQI